MTMMSPKKIKRKDAQKITLTVMTDIGFNFSAMLEATQPLEQLHGAPFLFRPSRMAKR
jgi:hypothetical protein